MDLAICPFCSCGCRVCSQTSNGRLVGMVPLHRHPVTRGSLCIRGWNAHEYLYHPDRLLNPLIRENGRQSPTSWENAIDVTTSELQRIRSKWGPASIGFIASSRCSNEDNYLLLKLARDVVGSTAIDARDRLTYFPLLSACRDSLGIGSSTATLEEVANADFILVVGADLSTSSPQTVSRIFTALNRGAKLAVVDPRATKLAKLAHYHLPIKPGADRWVLAAMLSLLIREERLDIEFLNTRTVGYQEIKKDLHDFSLSLAEEKSAVSSALLRSVAYDLTQAKNAVMIMGSGITNAEDIAKNAYALIDLALATGHIKAGSGILITGADNNTQGTWDMLSGLSGTAKSYPEILAAVNTGEIQALYVMGDDVLAFSEMAEALRKGISTLPLLVVADLFPTELAQMAHVVLPACAPAERAGTYVNLERRVQWSFPITNPPGNTKPDWEILHTIAVAMGSDFGFKRVENVTDSIASSTSYAGLTSTALQKVSSGITWPLDSHGVPGKSWLFPNWRGKFHSALPEEERESSQYPLVLIPGRFPTFWGTGVRTSKITALARENIRSAIYLSPEDAKKCGVKAGWRVKVVSPAWKLATSVVLDEKLPEGVAFLPLHNVDGQIAQNIGRSVPIRVESC